MQRKNFAIPDETTTLPKTRVDTVLIGDVRVVRVTYEPEWKWSTDVKPTVGTDSCQAHHVLCVLSGQLHVAMVDGSEMEIGPGDVADIPSGHDAWVIGSLPVVAIDLGGVFPSQK